MTLFVVHFDLYNFANLLHSRTARKVIIEKAYTVKKNWSNQLK